MVMHLFGHHVLVFNLSQSDQLLKKQNKKKSHIKPLGCCSKSRQWEQGDLSCALSKSDISVGYIQLWVLTNVALDTGEKRAGNLYELQWL